MKRFALLVLLLVLPVAIAVFQLRLAEGQTRLKIGYSSLTGGSSPAWVAIEERFFNKHGIQAEAIYIPGSTVEIAAVTAGEISMGIGGATAAMQMRLAGQPTIVIANAVKKLTYYLIASPAIRTPQDLKKKRIGIDRRGNITEYVAKLSLDAIGVDDREVTFTATGSQSSRFAALKQGYVQATVISPPLNLIARKLGFITMVNMLETDFEFPVSSLFTIESFLTNHEQTAAGAVKALSEAVAFFKSNETRGTEILRKYTRSEDTEALREMYKIYAKQALSTNPRISKKSMEAAVAQISEIDPRAKGQDASFFYTNRIIDRLEKEGFFDEIRARYRVE